MILAVDGGLATCGWSVIDPRAPVRVLDLGTLVQPADSKAKKATDRVRRAREQGELFARLITAHSIGVIGAETMSFAPRGSAAGKVGIGLAWGVLVGLASAFGLPLLDVTPKDWQHAVAGDGACSYDVLFEQLSAFVMHERNASVHCTLLAIPKAQRNHAIDSVGVGLFVALRRMSSRPPTTRKHVTQQGERSHDV